MTNLAKILYQIKKTYNEKLDYYEVNFNHAVLMDRKDAERECWRNENRQTTHETDAEEEEVLEAVAVTCSPLALPF